MKPFLPNHKFDMLNTHKYSQIPTHTHKYSRILRTHQLYAVAMLSHFAITGTDVVETETFKAFNAFKAQTGVILRD